MSKPEIKISKPVETPPSNNAEFVDTLTYKSVSFGDRTGHAKDARYLAISKYGEKEVAALTDREIGERFIEDGLIPVKINSNTQDDETIFLISKAVLRRVNVLSR